MSVGSKPRRSRDERERLILDTARRMFYAEGVHEVGMDALISATGLGKATVYRLYPTKAELIGATLRRSAAEIMALIDRDLDTAADPSEALGRILDAIESDLRQPEFRGCRFNNASVEFPDPAHPARVAARRYRAGLADRLVAVATDLTGEAASGRQLGRRIAVLIDGAYTSAAHLGADGPARDGLELARQLVADAR